jgi:omega-6 fatty acid desaturase (delta-12 desaturase)
MPQPLRWMTANIGIHHVHHLGSKVPFYRLPQVLKDHPHLRGVSRITLPDTVRAMKLTLWDEPSARLVSFRQARRDAAK